MIEMDPGRLPRGPDTQRWSGMSYAPYGTYLKSL
jgi:hypothetical protein